MTALRSLFLLIFVLVSLPGCDEPRYLPVLANQDAGMRDARTYDGATQNDARIDAVAYDASDASFSVPEPELRCDGHACYCEDGTAITLSRVCDRYRQCAGGEDEIHCGWPEIESTCVGADCRCPDGAALTSRQICNGFITCANAEDEAGCDWPELPLGHDRAGNWVASCNNGDAIPARHRCDQRFNCPGGEDEAGCVTASITCDAYARRCTCNDGREIHDHQRCDGYLHCANGEDEVGCGWPEMACTGSEYNARCSCDDGRLIRPADRCDDSWDCLGGEDERGCGYADYTCVGNDCMCEDGREFNDSKSSCVNCGGAEENCPGRFDIENHPTDYDFYAETTHLAPDDLQRRWRVIEAAR